MTTCTRVLGTMLLVCILLFLLWLEFVFLRLDLSTTTKFWTTLPKVAENFEWDGKRPLSILFMSWGSRGDHQPNIALGVELGRRGHNVTIMAMGKYKHLIEEHYPTIHYAPLQDDHLWLLAELFASSEGVDFISLTKDYAVNSSRQLVSQYMDQAQHADVLFGNHAAMISLHHLTVAEALQKPLFLTTHDYTLPTSAYSFDMANSRIKDLQRRTNVFNQRIFGVILGIVLTRVGSVSSPKNPEVTSWRTFRAELGLSTPWPFMQILSPERLADFPVFATANPILWPPPADQPPHWHWTGFFATPAPQNGTDNTDSAEVEEWMHERKPLNRSLLYFGQGSFQHHDQQVFTDLLIDTCTQLSMDAITLASTIDNDRVATLPPFIKVVKQLNQDIIFPKCDVIVHHGGAGTSSQCIRSGRPGICIPSMPFQEIWGGELEDYGAGVMLRPREATEAWEQPQNNKTNLLTKAVQRAMTPSIQQRAHKLGSLTLSGSGGVALAADKMMDHLNTLLMQKRKSVGEPVVTHEEEEAAEL